MKRRFIFSAAVMGLFVSASFGYDWGTNPGKGTEGNPYQISEPNQLNSIGADPSLLGKHFILTADLDCSGISSFTPIAPDLEPDDLRQFQGTPFRGTFDGAGHTIKNITIILPDTYYVALFGRIDIGSEIRNLGLQNIHISGKDFVGGLVGYNHEGTIRNCTISASEIQGSDIVGGLTGGNYYQGLIRDCHVIESIIGGDHEVGGLAGCNGYGIITQCSCEVQVTGNNSEVGGLAGENGGNGTIRDCCTSGSVIGNDDTVGGLVGLNYNIISECYSRASATATSTNVFVNRSIGGLVGTNSGTINACYSTGSATGIRFVGGLVGFNKYGTVNASFWDIESSGNSGSSGGKGLTTAQMKTAVYFRNAEWVNTEWVMADGEDYPHLVWEGTGYPSIPPVNPIALSGSGSESDPYQVWTANEFALLSWYTSILDKHIVLKTDLDPNGLQFEPIGDLGPFNGVFEGDNHVITNASIHKPDCDYVGLFGFIGADGQVRNLGMDAADLVGRGCTGALAGYTAGTISTCYISGSVRGTEIFVGGLGGLNRGTISVCHATGFVTVEGSDTCVGGLIGSNESAISECFSTGLVTGDSRAGGFVGKNTGQIDDCYATGPVTGSYQTGGLVGENSGQIRKCHAIGPVDGRNGGAGGLIGGGLGSISESWATGSVTGYNSVGGLAGTFGDGVITNCYATGSATGNWYIGGLVGISYPKCTVHRCYSTGSATGTKRTGGLVGYNMGSTISDCYAKGTVQGDTFVGGLFGENKGSISNCYATGLIDGGEYAGGFAGYNDSVVINSCFWDMQASGITVGVGEGPSDGVYGRTTEQMQQQVTFTDYGWDFEEIWEICEGTSYPLLVWQIPAGDFVCPDGVGMEDAEVLGGCWLANIDLDTELDDDGDTVVSLAELARIGQYWMAVGCGDCGGMDVTGDGQITVDDLSAVAEDWLMETYSECDMADMDGDGFVDLADWAAFAGHWMEGE